MDSSPKTSAQDTNKNATTNQAGQIEKGARTEIKGLRIRTNVKAGGSAIW